MNNIKSNEWTIVDNKLTKIFEFADFAEALEFVNKVGEIAEEKNHHPDVLIHDYNKVKVMTISHDQNEVTDRDYELADFIDNFVE